ncbi:MAG: hypothetical protein V3S32_06290 [Acidimicrobiia bacterium]
MTEEHDGDIHDAAKPTADALAALFGGAAPGTVFSEPIHIGDDLVITAVAWERAGRVWFWRWRRPHQPARQWAWIGGPLWRSFTGQARCSDSDTSAGVEVKPVIDFTKIGVTLLLGLIGVWRVFRN